jgi:signal transduction histidine kinase
VARHAHATLTTVQVKKTPHGIGVEIRDNGRAFDVQRVLGSRTRKHLGLLGMQERVEMVGGLLSIESFPGKGTAVCAYVPLDEVAKTATP